MTEAEAIKAQEEIEAVLNKHKLWYSVKHERKPALKMIRIEEISIKVTNGR